MSVQTNVRHGISLHTCLYRQAPHLCTVMSVERHVMSLLHMYRRASRNEYIICLSLCLPFGLSLSLCLSHSLRLSHWNTLARSLYFSLYPSPPQTHTHTYTLTQSPTSKAILPSASQVLRIQNSHTNAHTRTHKNIVTQCNTRQHKRQHNTRHCNTHHNTLQHSRILQHTP